MEENKDLQARQESCEICPILTINHESGVRSDIKYCVLEAALKQAKNQYTTCGRDLDIKFNKVDTEFTATPEFIQAVKELKEKTDVIDSGFLDTIEKQAEKL